MRVLITVAFLLVNNDEKYFTLRIFHVEENTTKPLMLVLSCVFNHKQVYRLCYTTQFLNKTKKRELHEKVAFKHPIIDCVILRDFRKRNLTWYAAPGVLFIKKPLTCFIKNENKK